MRLSIGIPSIIFGVAAGVHAALVFFTNVIAQDSNTKILGYSLVVVALLFIFGGSFALEFMERAKQLYIAATVVGIAITFGSSYSMALWAVLAILLAAMSDNAIPRKARVEQSLPAPPLE